MTKVILFVALVLILWKRSEQNVVKNTVPILNGDKFVLHCDEEITLDNPATFETFQNTINNITTIVIDSCPPPIKGSYADVFRQLNVNINKVTSLHLVNPPRTENRRNFERGLETRRPQSHHFSGLNLDELKILNGNAPTALEIDLHFLKNLTNLTKLTIDNCDIRGPFPRTTKLERVEISGGVLYGDVGDCQGFKVLHLTNINIFGGKDENQYKYLKNCTRLEELKLEEMDGRVCELHLLRSLSKTVTNITVRNCGINDFPLSQTLYTEAFSLEVYNEKVHDFILKHLDVSHNRIDSATFLSSHNGLETLDLSHNYLKRGMYYLANVIELKVDDNDFENYCNDSLPYKDRPNNYYLKKLPLETLSAVGTGMRALCFDSMQLSRLQLLNLTHNNISVLDYRELYNVSGDYKVDLRHNPLVRVDISQEDYEALKQNDSSVSHWRKIRIITDARLPCNCSNAWFARAVRNRLLSVEGATCDDGTPLELPRLSYGLQGCSAACEGDTGCSSANILNKFKNVKDHVVSVFTEQTSLWWIFSRAFDYVWNKFVF